MQNQLKNMKDLSLIYNCKNIIRDKTLSTLIS